MTDVDWTEVKHEATTAKAKRQAQKQMLYAWVYSGKPESEWPKAIRDMYDDFINGTITFHCQ